MMAAAKTAFFILLCCLAGTHAFAAAQAQLRLQVQLDAGVIKVADIWRDAGAKADTVIGVAPPPGRSITIEAAQLAYIAHLYDVNWRPISGVERSVVERAGRPLTRDEMIEPIKRSLVDAGAPPTVTVEFANFAPILVPPRSFPLLAVESLAYDPASQRFFADLVASTEGMQTQRMRVDGRALNMVTAVVAARRLEPGDVIAPSDVRTMQIAERRLAGPAVSDVSQVLGQTPKRTIVTGQPLAVADFGPPLMVQKGATVVIVLETGNMSLASQGLALSSGGRDDMIQVMNPLSRAVVAARVTGPGRAIILPGSTPLVPPTHVSPKNPEVAN
jgi:flagellar basal body P-ring formation protein FlgA